MSRLGGYTLSVLFVMGRGDGEVSLRISLIRQILLIVDPII